MAKRDADIKISTDALYHMNTLQHEALVANVLSEGKWESVNEFKIWWDHMSEALMISIPMPSSAPFVLGIEKDGYTHS